MQNQMTSNNNKIYKKAQLQKYLLLLFKYYNYVWFEYNLYVIVHI